MLFPTLTFGLFFLLVYAVAWALKASNEWRKIFLLRRLLVLLRRLGHALRRCC